MYWIFGKWLYPYWSHRWNSNSPVIETVDKLINVISDKKTYDLGINANKYMIISMQATNRQGWEFFVTRGVSGIDAQDNWAVSFATIPNGSFAFKIITLKMK